MTALAAAICQAQEATRHVKNAVHGVVCSLPNETYGFFGWPSIARQADGTLCVVASGMRKDHICPWGRTTLCKSRDDGTTWSHPQVINNTPLDDRDAGIVSLGGQRLAVTWFTSNTYWVMHSWNLCNKDGTWKDKAMGAILDTWNVELIHRELGSFVRVSPDGEYWGEAFRAPVSSPHGFIVLKDGSWLYFGKEWTLDGEGMAYYMKEDTPICAVRSTDEGRTWERLGTVPLPPGVVYSRCHEPHVVELDDGELLGAIRVEGPFSVWLSRSGDGGKTWSTMEDVGCLGSPPHLLRHSSGAIVCAFGYRTPAYGQRCMISYDNGRTWDKNIVIRDDGMNHELGYPASVELADGSIFTVYYQFIRGQRKSSILWSRWQLPER
jgi:hypothetical protein